MTSEVAVFGEALFDLIEQEQGEFKPFVGGSPFNVATGFSRQGIRCTYVSPISTDRYGEKLLRFAQDENIELPEGNRSECPTSLALVFHDRPDQPDYTLYRKGVADLNIDAQRLLSIIPENITLFHTGSLALVPEMLDTLTAVFTELRDRGVKLSIDVNMRHGVEKDVQKYIDTVNKLIPYADMIKVSDEDLELLGNEGSPQEGAKQILEKLQDGVVVLTLGKEGAEIYTRNFHFAGEAYAPRVFGDTVGAGDTFFSSFLSDLLHDDAFHLPWDRLKLRQSLIYGLMAATLNVEKQGCQPPSREMVVQSLERASIQ